MGLIGRREDALERKKAWIDCPKIRTHILDVADKRAVKGLMQQYDVGVIALPDRKTSYKVVETAIEAGLNIVDMLEEYHRRSDPYEVDQSSIRKARRAAHPCRVMINESASFSVWGMLSCPPKNIEKEQS